MDDEPSSAGQFCNFCFASVRVASGLITQIAEQKADGKLPVLRGADAWPPLAQKYLQHLHQEAAKPREPQRHWLARWAGPLSCGVILLVFGFVAQTYLGHRSAMADSSATPPADRSVVPPLILETSPTPAPLLGHDDDKLPTNEHQ